MCCSLAATLNWDCFLTVLRSQKLPVIIKRRQHLSNLFSLSRQVSGIAGLLVKSPNCLTQGSSCSPSQRNTCCIGSLMGPLLRPAGLNVLTNACRSI